MSAETPTIFPGDEPGSRGSLSADAVARLLHIGIGGPPRPVEHLINRVRRADGMSWFVQSALQFAKLGEGDIDKLVEGGLPLESLKAMKERAKQGMASANHNDAKLSATAAYLVSVAAALRGHRAFISGRPRDEVDRVFIDLAEAVHQPWSELLLRAAETPAGDAGAHA